jgi:Dolichyl-phosphate-mannose-protein mannosyltransferase
MLLILPFFLILGLFLPGLFLAKYLRHGLWWASAFPISLLILFHIVFWLGIFHVPITLWSVLPCLAAASAAAYWLQRRSAVPAKTEPEAPLPRLDQILILSSGFIGAILLVRSAVSPLIGFDTRFRWDFLAQRLLALGRFDFYPPLTAVDFRTYFLVDGIPPLVSFTHWWMYASAGQHLPILISLFVAAQFVCTLAFTYGTASAIFSRRAGVFAAAILTACPLFFRSVALGQETGLTALAIAAMLYFIVTARQPGDARAIVSAGLAAALCALSREYGWIALVAGAIALLWRRESLKQVFVFAGVTAAVAGPWYVRNWMLAGNPFYSLRFMDFAVNPIHDAILQHYNDLLGLGRWTSGTWASLFWFLLLFATLQVVAGLPGGFTRFRRNGYLIVIALLLSAVWIQSAGYTSGGIEISTRVLSPMWVVLSITAAGLLEPLTRRAGWNTAIVAVILLCQFWTAAQGAMYPNKPLSMTLSEWPGKMFRSVPEEAEFRLTDQIAAYLPAGSRVLSDSAHLHAAMLEKGIEVVPVWSPEVRFIFSLPPEEAERQLRALHIGNVAYYPQSLNTGYLVAHSPFYAALPRRWRVKAQVKGTFFYILEPK